LIKKYKRNKRDFILIPFFIVVGVICAIQIPIGIYNWLFNPIPNSTQIDRIDKRDNGRKIEIK